MTRKHLSQSGITRTQATSTLEQQSQSNWATGVVLKGGILAPSRAFFGIAARLILLLALATLHAKAQTPQAPESPGKGSAQDNRTPTYTPTEVQALRLKVAQQSAQLAQSQLREAQQAFQSALANLSSEAEKVRLENKWPDDVTMDYDKLTFAKKAASPMAKEPMKK